MKMLRSFYSVWILHVALTLLAMVHAQDDQSGFISINCGIAEGSKYTDAKTGITYVSDADFIEGGVTAEILPEYVYSNLDFPLKTLRSFPQNKRSCYILKPKQGKNNRYLIRVWFMYGNYDSKNQTQDFDLYLGADFWGQVYSTDPSDELYREIIHLASSDYIHICLVKTGESNPFISAIELRFMDISMDEPPSASLQLSYNRADFGSTERVRYVDDKYDRTWYRWTVRGTRVAKTFDTISPRYFKVPSKVMSTAITPTISTNDIYLTFDATINEKYFFYLHFAEVEILKSNETREFNIYLDEEFWYGPLSPSTNTISIESKLPRTGSSSYTFKINKTLSSTLPPLVNAMEIYRVKQFQRQQTDDQDAAAIWNIKSTYGLKRNWQGDPCIPSESLWDGLGCNYGDLRAAKIISLNLSSSRLSGQIATALANLTMIESLDLSYNNLTGDVPEFLARQDHLRILNLKGNNFTRPLPAELLAKSNKGSLFLSIESISEEDKSSCLEGSCRKSKGTNVVIPVTTTIGGVIMLLIALAIIWTIKQRKTKDLNLKDELFTPRKQFTYSEVQSITNNFKTVIGKGGFGTVYHGYNGKDQVAVKMLTESSVQGYKEFQAEVKLLMDVRHKNITSLVGYCNDNTHKGIIYEYMANGNLEKHLFDGNPRVLSWETRLQIACDAAEGLVYLHHGCRPPIVHRDVKPSNILLNDVFQAKLADFGMSRAFKTEDATHESTVVVGTRGYLDPEYYITNWLSEKSDVYSFGVVLLEFITGRRATSENTHLIDQVKSMVARGNINYLIDPRLEGKFNTNSAWKVVELAIACVSHTSIERPTMNNVAAELKNCLQAEKAGNDRPNDQSGHVSFNVEAVNGPNAR
ncbi:putative LRR receptor-like serine/threonine-protein kinase At1g05700 [Bidens hawaiensis]|uniref:putative LRR receptor-like serine/threonine-protein kinase At1g05700 n=1 Tax=Bidens hawaiensis TaxID=980011 RepID=UPI00404AE3DD